MRLFLIGAFLFPVLLLGATPPPAIATTTPYRTATAPMGRPNPSPKPRAYAARKPIMILTLARKSATVITQARKITKAVSGDLGVVWVEPFQKATPAIRIRSEGAGVTNLLVWTTDSQVHTYRVKVK